MSMTVLLAEREAATRGLLERQLKVDGFELAEPGCAPDLVLAGDEATLERWRGEAPVIVLGRAEADAVERVRAFRRGCDDLCVPETEFGLAELGSGTCGCG